jgi:hypothetical protein
MQDKRIKTYDTFAKGDVPPQSVDGPLAEGMVIEDILLIIKNKGGFKRIGIDERAPESEGQKTEEKNAGLSERLHVFILTQTKMIRNSYGGLYNLPSATTGANAREKR